MGEMISLIDWWAFLNLFWTYDQKFSSNPRYMSYFTVFCVVWSGMFISYITFCLESRESSIKPGLSLDMMTYFIQCSGMSRGRAVVARQAHNLKVGGSIPPPATKRHFNPHSSVGIFCTSRSNQLPLEIPWRFFYWFVVPTKVGIHTKTQFPYWFVWYFWWQKYPKTIQGTQTRFPFWQLIFCIHDAQTVCPLKTLFCTASPFTKKGFLKIEISIISWKNRVSMFHLLVIAKSLQ